MSVTFDFFSAIGALFGAAPPFDCALSTPFTESMNDTKNTKVKR
jgi:hypothetical protein